MADCVREQARELVPELRLRGWSVGQGTKPLLNRDGFDILKESITPPREDVPLEVVQVQLDGHRGAESLDEVCRPVAFRYNLCSWK
jgi:hypothetical protein